MRGPAQNCIFLGSGGDLREWTTVYKSSDLSLDECDLLVKSVNEALGELCEVDVDLELFYEFKRGPLPTEDKVAYINLECAWKAVWEYANAAETPANGDDRHEILWFNKFVSERADAIRSMRPSQVEQVTVAVAPDGVTSVDGGVNNSHTIPPSLIQENESVKQTYHDPDNYERNVFIYKLRIKNMTLMKIREAIELSPKKFNLLASDNAVRNAIRSIAIAHGWPMIKGQNGRPRNSDA